MRTVKNGLAIGLGFSLSLVGCASILGDFTTTTDNGPVDGSAPMDGTAPLPDGAVHVDAGADHAAPPPDGSTGDAPPPNAAQLSAGSPTLDFGMVTAGQTLTPGTIDVTNKGTASTGALTTSITGAAYTVVTDGCKGQTLGPQGVCHVQIALDDSTAGTPTGTFTIVDTASDTLAVPLKADVLKPGALTVMPQTNDYKSWLIGASSPAQIYTVTNSGMTTSGTITVSLQPTNGTAASEFPVTDGCTGKQLAPNGTCTVSVLFTPGARGNRTATLAIDASPGGPATASLSGTGLAPTSLSISPTPYPFTTTTAGTKGPQQAFTVTNGGDVPSAALQTMLVPGGGTTASEFAVVSDTCNGAMVAGGASCAVTVQFDPATYGAKSATLTENGGAGNSPVAQISGTGEDTLTLSVTKQGTGGGTVTDASGAINCGATCSAGFTRTTTDPMVTLTASADATSTFAGWSGGGCSGTGTCQVTLSAATSVIATFNKAQETLTVSLRAIGAGQSGTISSSPSGISCTGPVCTSSASFDIGTVVTLNVSGISASAIAAWSPSSCTGASCKVTMSAPQTVRYTATTNNIIFVTSSLMNGNLGGLAGADTACATAATNAGLPGHYVAWLASSSTTANSRLGTARGWIRPDGKPFADTVGTAGAKTGLINGQIWYPPNLNELGNLEHVSTWAATQAGGDGTVNPPTYNDCSGWTSASSSLTALYGQSDCASRDWGPTFYGVGCSAALALYCMGTDLATSVTPATTTGRHAFLSTGNFSPTNGSPSLANADSMCTSEASSGGLPNASSFKAFLAPSGASAASRFNLGGANWIRPDGVLIASSVQNLLAGNLLVPIAQHADGSYLINGQAANTWSGAPDGNTAGTAATTCNNWASNVSTSTAEVGLASNTTNQFMGSWNAQPCNFTSNVYCFEN